ncbi:MAG: NAD-dependent epimerase/dehydratase family protein [Ignavibacteriales bacterium]|nr:NAD-dependent epimerase/dehydratase family protein [Ignavibacteriales bacterium]
MHTILGAGGAIGTPLANLLLEKGEKVRLASRGKRIVSGAESIQCDLLSFKETLSAVQGSAVVYLLAGLQYNHTIWQAQWPVIMNNCIKACKETGAHFIFFDNVYMYGLVEGPMLETSPYNPCSKKGEVRAKIARMLGDEMQANSINAMIARAADFYGPYADKTSIMSILVFDKLLKGQTPQWTGNIKVPHSLTYTLDAAKALVLLANDPKALQQVWHLPTRNPALTGEEYIQIAADILKLAKKPMVLKTWMLKVFGLFDKTVAELVEMQYQNEYPYHFDSTKFETAFKYKPIEYRVGIEESLKHFKQKQ